MRKKLKGRHEPRDGSQDEIANANGHQDGTNRDTDPPSTSSSQSVRVSGIDIEWERSRGLCTFEKLPAAMMWIDTTLAGLLSGVQAMVGTKRFGLALQREGRNSVEADWQVISQFPEFSSGFEAIANIAAVAGWGEWQLLSLDEEKKEARIRVSNGWEGRYQKSLGVCWGSGMLAGKMAGYCSRLFKTNCWAEQTAFIARGDPWDEFDVHPSERSIEKEIEDLLATDGATRADMAVAMQKLADSEQKYRLLVDNAKDAIFIVQDARIRYANPSTSVLIGYTEEELGEIDLIGIIHPEDRQMVLDRHTRRLQGEPIPHTYSFRGINKAGETRWVELNAVVIDWEGKPATLNFARDITTQRKLEAQLLRAQKMEVVGTLAGGVAHDFNNLLQGIQGYAELAQLGKNKDDPGYAELMEIVRAAQRGSDLSRRLLTLSRRTESDLRAVDLNELIQNILRLLSRVIPKMIEIEIHLDNEISIVQADPVQIEQIMMNLTLNAKDAMSEGGVLSISTQNQTLDESFCRFHAGARPGAYVLLSIRDSGQGMSKETREHIFEPFFTTKKFGEGTGLGLSMVYGIVKNHSGYITCESELGKGTAFKIYLPAAQSSEALTTAETTAGPHGRGETILVVDDEAFLRDLLERILTEYDYEVMTAADGASAIALYREQIGEIDVVILDLLMPGMGGRRCLKELLHIDPQAKILFASGYSPDGSSEQALEMGARGFIGKPYRISELLQRIREALDTDGA
jgi:PAS domain S-box-containing protein